METAKKRLKAIQNCFFFEKRLEKACKRLKTGFFDMPCNKNLLWEKKPNLARKL